MKQNIGFLAQEITLSAIFIVEIAFICRRMHIFFLLFFRLLKMMQHFFFHVAFRFFFFLTEEFNSPDILITGNYNMVTQFVSRIFSEIK